MEDEWISRLKGHAELVQNLVKEVPRALDRPNLTLDHATRLHAVIEKGVRDFDEVLKLLDGSEGEETYRQAGESLARTWQHLSDVAEDKVRFLRDRNQRSLQDFRTLTIAYCLNSTTMMRRNGLITIATNKRTIRR